MAPCGLVVHASSTLTLQEQGTLALLQGPKALMLTKPLHALLLCGCPDKTFLGASGDAAGLTRDISGVMTSMIPT